MGWGIAVKVSQGEYCLVSEGCVSIGELRCVAEWIVLAVLDGRVALRIGM